MVACGSSSSRVATYVRTELTRRQLFPDLAIDISCNQLFDFEYYLEEVIGLCARSCTLSAKSAREDDEEDFEGA